MCKTSKAILFGMLLMVCAVIGLAQRTQSPAPKAGIPKPKPASAQMSKTSPGLPLGPISKAQCSWGVALINHETDAVGHLERSDLTEGSARWPTPPSEALDAFVREIAESMQQHETGFTLGVLEDDPIKRAKEFKRRRAELSLDQRLLAYILELRGCSITHDDVRFSK